MQFNEEYGPWCLILGGSEGIGEAYARAVAARGLNLCLVARKPGPLQALAQALRDAHPAITVRTLSQDLGVDEAPAAIAQATADIDVGLLIYNAGAEPAYGKFLDHDWSLLHNRLIRNFVVKTAIVHHYAGRMRPRHRGGVVLLGSISGFFGSPGFALYAASKAFTHSLSEGLWHEFRADGIDVVCPVVGPTDTPTMVNAYGRSTGHATDAGWIAEQTLARLKRGPIWVADDIAEQVAALAAMPPAERATVADAMAVEFVNKNKKQSG